MKEKAVLEAQGYNMEKAKQDTTYCINDKCDKKCFRHHSHYEFDEKENYWQQEYCIEFLKRHYKGEVQDEI